MTDMTQTGTAWDVQPTWPLTGRDTEVATVTAALDDPRCHAVIVSGAAGTGRSRLAEECLALAARRGRRTGRAVASRAAAAVPLGAIAHLLPTGFLAEPATAAPGDGDRSILLVDDIHLLDASSTTRLRTLLDAGVITLIATARTDEPAVPAAKALLASEGAFRVELAPLGPDAVASLLRQVLGGPVSKRALHRLCSASGGTVLYLRELVTAALRGGRLSLNHGFWDLADGPLTGTPLLTELLDLRLAQAGPDSRPAAELLALCGPVRLTDLRDVATADLLTRLEQHGLITITPDDRPATVRLRHPLYAAILREHMPLLARREILHQQMERLGARSAGRREDALRLTARHLAAAAAPDTELVLQAAELASSEHDHEQVVELLSAVGAGQQTFATLLALARSNFLLGRWRAAERALAEADAAAGDERDHLRLTGLRVANLLRSGAPPSRARAANDATRTLVTTAAGRATLRCNEAGITLASGRPADALRLLHELPGEPRDADSHRRWLHGAHLKACALTLAGRPVEAVALAERLCAASAQDACVEPAERLSVLVHALTEDGRLAEASRIGTREYQRLLARGTLAAQVWLAVLLGRIEWLAGRPVSARQWYAEAVTLSRGIEHFGARRVALSGMAATWALTGDLAAADAALAELHAMPGTAPHLLPVGEEHLGEAWVAAARGNLPSAGRTLLRAALTARRNGHLASEALLLTDAARLGGAREVRSRLAELAGHGDLFAARAALADALADGGPDTLAAAGARLAGLGAHLLAAEALTLAATAFRRTAQPHRAKVTSASAQAALAQCEGARTPNLRSAPVLLALTAREQEIAFLAAGGAQSKDIAVTLGISVRTVDNTLQRAYTKIGVASRRELATAISGAPHRLTPSLGLSPSVDHGR